MAGAPGPPDAPARLYPLRGSPFHVPGMHTHIPPATLQAATELNEAGNAAGAVRACREVLARDPDDLEALSLLGRLMQDAARKARATHDGVAALEGDGDADGADARRDERGWLDEAERCFRRVIAGDPARTDGRVALGRTLTNLGRFAEAAGVFAEAVRREPANAELRIALADAHRTSGNYAAAIETLERVVEMEPRNVIAHLNLFATLYIVGDHPRAWAENEWRMEGYSSGLDQPVWDGGPLEGRAILLHAEQGLGDQIQFIRFARRLKEQGARVIVQCNASLYRLLLTCPGIDQVVMMGAELPPFDLQLFPGSLPHLLGTTLETIPGGDVPYVHAEAHQVERWRTILARFAGLRIGINWAGNRYNLPGHNREIPLAAFFPLARIPGVHLFSLQKGEGADALRAKPADVRIPDLGQYFVDMQDTAAAVTALDLVITNDTSIAHLAGALGKPVWVVLPRQACWRWQRGRDDCPWYPTMRLFRQPWGVTWGATLARVEAAVRDLLAQRAGDETGVGAAAQPLAVAAGG